MHHAVDSLGYGSDACTVFGRRKDGVNHFGDVAHEVGSKTAGGDSRSAETDTRGLKGRAAVEGTMFLFAVISASTSTFSATLPVSSGNLVRRSTRMQWLSVPPETILYPMSRRASARAAAFSLNLLLIGGKSGLERFVESHSLACDDVFEWAALHAGNTAESRSCDIMGFRLWAIFAPGVLEVFAHKYDTTAGTTESFVSGRGDDVGILYRVIEQTAAIRPAG